MWARQYVYFGLFSEVVPAAEMTARLGLEADEVVVRGARWERPPVPRAHGWKVVCRQPGIPVDEQVERVVGRLLPHVDAIAGLAAELRRGERGWARLSVVRYFEDDGADGTLGWALGPEVMRFLVDVGAWLDVDEYDLLGPEEV